MASKIPLCQFCGEELEPGWDESGDVYWVCINEDCPSFDA